MNKILKTALIGVGIYEGCNLIWDLGKAYMLGTMARYNVTANETIDCLATDKRTRLKLISKCATIFKQEKSRI